MAITIPIVTVDTYLVMLDDLTSPTELLGYMTLKVGQTATLPPGTLYETYLDKFKYKGRLSQFDINLSIDEI